MRAPSRPKTENREYRSAKHEGTPASGRGVAARVRLAQAEVAR
jgi:hypothetical protein